MTRPERRIMDLGTARAWRDALRRDGCMLAVTNGCFDLLHRGHVESLYAARHEADALIVFVNSDASVRLQKGQGRPIVPQGDRAALLASLRCVDAVVIFDGTDCAAEIAAIDPDVYVKSAEYRDRQDPAEKAALQRCGTTTVWLRRLPGMSTSGILERLGNGDASGVRGVADSPDPSSMQSAADTAASGVAAAVASPRPAMADAGTRGEAAGLPAGHMEMTGTPDWGVP